MKFINIFVLILLTSCGGGGYNGYYSEPEPVYYDDPDDFFAALVNEINYTDKQKRLINYGKRYLGARYVYGGSSPEQGFDCSGFTQYIYKQSLGISLPRMTKNQHRVGVSVHPDRLKPGDLVFFDLSNRLSHVGVYLGDGKFFHASTSRKQLIIADMRKKYFAKRFNSAKRVLN